MNSEKFTHKTNEALAAALKIATECGHAQYTAVHLVIALTEDKGGVLRQAITGGEETAETVQRVLRQAWNKLSSQAPKKHSSRARKKLPSQDPDPDSIPRSTSLIKSIKRAQSSQKSKGDTHLAVDHLILGVLQDSQVSDCFREAAVSMVTVKSEVEKLRGALRTYGRDLVEDAGKLDPVIGRDEEIMRLLVILCKRNNNNALLIGEPGVGKTAVVEGLAQRIFRGEVPSNFVKVRLIALDMAALVAGATYTGQFEERLQSVLKEVEEAHGEVILFIDEIHLVLGAGRDEGSMDAANFFKPMLARGQLRCIGATTPEKYRKYVEKDAAFERRFERVDLAEPSETETVNILRGLKKIFERHHHVRISDKALEDAAQLSSRYITGRCLPGKAIDVVDGACANVIVRRGVELQALKKEKDKGSKARLAEERYDLRNKLQPFKEKERVDEIRGLKQECEGKLQIAWEEVGPDQIAEYVSGLADVPVTRLGQNERKRLIGLPGRLHERVVGQDEAVQAVANAVLISGARRKRPPGPIGSFLFLGRTGVGKTELAKALAAQLFDDENKLVRIDMSEYGEQNSVARLIGPPPGYVGYEEGGQLTEAVSRRPYSVVLFDEAEKAHASVFHTFLQMLDDGRLTDGQGRTVSFSNTVIIMTSNLGAEHLPDAREDAMQEVRKHFRPEFLGRLDEIIVFDSLSHNELRRVARLQMNDAERLLAENGAALGVIPEDAVDLVLEQAYDAVYGVRSLRRWLKKRVLTPLSKMIINEEIYENSTVHIEVMGERQELSFRVERNGGNR